MELTPFILCVWFSIWRTVCSCWSSYYRMSLSLIQRYVSVCREDIGPPLSSPSLLPLSPPPLISLRFLLPFQLRVLLVLSVLMDRMGPHIQPYVHTLLQCLPSLWEDSSQENTSLLRVGILTALTNVVCGLGGLSVQLHDFIVPVIHLGTDVKSVRNVEWVQL